MNFGAIPSGFDSFIEGAAALSVIYWLVASGCSFIAEVFSAMANNQDTAITLALASTIGPQSYSLSRVRRGVFAAQHDI